MGSFSQGTDGTQIDQNQNSRVSADISQYPYYPYLNHQYESLHDSGKGNSSEALLLSEKGPQRVVPLRREPLVVEEINRLYHRYTPS